MGGWARLGGVAHIVIRLGDGSWPGFALERLLEHVLNRAPTRDGTRTLVIVGGRESQREKVTSIWGKPAGKSQGARMWRGRFVVLGARHATRGSTQRSWDWSASWWAQWVCCLLASEECKTPPAVLESSQRLEQVDEQLV